MTELADIVGAVRPVETLLVVDAMTGQEAVAVAQAFDMSVPLTGLVLTKIDGDARGGAALSISSVTGLPVKFMGAGEDRRPQVFYPDRPRRILGMGDTSPGQRARRRTTRAGRQARSSARRRYPRR
jgi:signal recognition particle subunit SRP54